jgi:hypothetical protein
MYFSTHPTSEYNSDIDSDIEEDIQNDYVCLICLDPDNNTNKIKLLTDFRYIKPSCNCKPKIHSKCIEKWILTSPTCPICRIEMNIITITIFNETFVNYFNITYISYGIGLMYFIYCSTLIKMIIITLYNIYFCYSIYVLCNNYIIIDNYYGNDYEIY